MTESGVGPERLALGGETSPPRGRRPWSGRTGAQRAGGVDVAAADVGGAALGAQAATGITAAVQATADRAAVALLVQTRLADAGARGDARGHQGLFHVMLLGVAE